MKLFKPSLPEKCPNTEFFWSEYGKYEPEETPYLDTCHAVPRISTEK